MKRYYYRFFLTLCMLNILAVDRPRKAHISVIGTCHCLNSKFCKCCHTLNKVVNTPLVDTSSNQGVSLEVTNDNNMTANEIMEFTSVLDGDLQMVEVNNTSLGFKNVSFSRYNMIFILLSIFLIILLGHKLFVKYKKGQKDNWSR